MQNHDAQGSLSFQECYQYPGSEFSLPAHLSSVGNQEMLISLNIDC